MPTNANLMIRNFDFDVFYKWANEHANGVTAVARELGYNDSFFANARKRNAIRPNSYKFLLMRYNLPEGTFIKKVEKSESKNETTVDATAEIKARFTDIGNELTDLNIAINKLGNIMMQILEYVGDIRKELK